MCQAIFPTGIANQVLSYTDGHPTNQELVHYQVARLAQEYSLFHP
jgi:hypothetical protein